LTQLENIDRTADLFEKMAIQSEHSRQQRLGLDEKPNDKHDEMLHQLAERGNEVKIVIDERKSGMLNCILVTQICIVIQLFPIPLKLNKDR